MLLQQPEDAQNAGMRPRFDGRLHLAQPGIGEGGLLPGAHHAVIFQIGAKHGAQEIAQAAACVGAGGAAFGPQVEIAEAFQQFVHEDYEKLPLGAEVNIEGPRGRASPRGDRLD